jgi:protein-S-isoprenylcysteine O-methyltransferase Ste14
LNPKQSSGSWLDLRIPPVILGALIAFLMWLSFRCAPALAFEFTGRRAVALGLVLLGSVVSISGVVSFRRAKTTVNPTTPGLASALVVSGIYRFTRNPMYLGFLLTLLAWAVWVANALALAWVPVFVVYMNRFQIGPEERALATLFERDYPAYQARVRRWI